MIKFGKLETGDMFEFDGQRWVVIPMIKSGACGCSPKFNAQGVDDPEMFGLFTSLNKVHKIEQFRTHPDNLDDIQHRTRFYKRIIATDDALPVSTQVVGVIPKVVDTFIEFDENDTWLIHFGLGEEKRIPYYEKFVSANWVSESVTG